MVIPNLNFLEAITTVAWAQHRFLRLAVNCRSDGPEGWRPSNTRQRRQLGNAADYSELDE